MAEKPKTHFVITGNRLTDGRVLYLRADRSWSELWVEAQEHADAEMRDLELSAIKERDRTVVTGIYALEVGITADGRRQLSARERIRAGGEADVRKRLGVGA